MSARWPNTTSPRKPQISVRYDTFEKLQRRAYRQGMPVSVTLDRLIVGALAAWVTCIKCGQKYSELKHVCLEEMELEDL